MSTTGQPSRAAFPPRLGRPLVDDVTLAALETASNSAWRFVHITLQDWGLFSLVSDAERVAVELVTRAVKTTGKPGPHPRWSDLDDLATIGVRVSVEYGGVLLIQVRDCDPTCPIPAKGAYLDQHLTVVHELSHGWNWYPLDNGKVIWAELIPRQAQPPGVLPQRTAAYFSYPGPDASVAPLQDIRLMRRVHDGLHRTDTERGM